MSTQQSKVMAGMLTIMMVVGMNCRAAVTNYVAQAGQTPVPNYTNWADASSNIQDAINVAIAGDTVLVSNGTYNLTNQIEIRSNIIVQSLNGTNVTFINGNYPTYTNRCVYMLAGTLDGFTISNGFLTNGTPGNAWVGGAGIAIGYNATYVTVKNCYIYKNFITNWGGGGIGVNQAYDVIISNCTVAGNTCDSTRTGGGIYLDYAYRGLLIDSYISGNTSGYGGGVANENASCRITNCTIAGNTAIKNGGGVILQNVSGVALANCVISNNSAPSAGAMLIYGSKVINSIIIDNRENGLMVFGVDIANGGIMSNCYGNPVSSSNYEGWQVEYPTGQVVVVNEPTPGGAKSYLFLKDNSKMGSGLCSISKSDLPVSTNNRYRFEFNAMCSAFSFQIVERPSGKTHEFFGGSRSWHTAELPPLSNQWRNYSFTLGAYCGIKPENELTGINSESVERDKQFNQRFLDSATKSITVSIFPAPVGEISIADLKMIAIDEPVVSLWEVVWDKLVYKPGENANFTARLVNVTGSQQKVRLQVEVVSEINDRITVFNKEITVPALQASADGKYQPFDYNVSWKAKGVYYGCELVASLWDGKNLLDRKSDTFCITDNPTIIGQWMGGKYCTWGETFANPIGSAVALVPEDPDFPEDRPYFTDQCQYKKTLKGLRDNTGAARKRGEVRMSYFFPAAGGIPGMEWAREHPEWLLYLGRNGQPAGGFNVLHDRAMEWAWKHPELLIDASGEERNKGIFAQPKPELLKLYPNVDPAEFEFRVGWEQYMINSVPAGVVEDIAPHIIAAARIAGYGGVRYDGHLSAVWSPEVQQAFGMPEMVDFEGKPMPSSEEADRIGVAHEKLMREIVEKAVPGFRWGYNIDRPTENFGRFCPQTYLACVRNSPALYESSEFHRTPEWEQVRQIMIEDIDYLRKVLAPDDTAYHIGYIGQMMHGPAWTGHAFAIILAPGGHFYTYCSDWYNRYALRYAAILYDKARVHVTENVESRAQVTADREIWWKEYLYDRQISKARSQTILHILNTPVQKNHGAAQGNNYRHPDTPLAKEVKVKLRIPTGKKLVRATVLSPDDGIYLQQELNPVNLDDGWLLFNLPPVHFWNTLVVEWRE